MSVTKSQLLSWLEEGSATHEDLIDELGDPSPKEKRSLAALLGKLARAGVVVERYGRWYRAPQTPAAWQEALRVPCPHCGARVGRACDGNRSSAGGPHALRRVAARKAEGPRGAA